MNIHPLALTLLLTTTTLLSALSPISPLAGVTTPRHITPHTPSPQPTNKTKSPKPTPTTTHRKNKKMHRPTRAPRQPHTKDLEKKIHHLDTEEYAAFLNKEAQLLRTQWEPWDLLPEEQQKRLHATKQSMAEQLIARTRPDTNDQAKQETWINFATRLRRESTRPKKHREAISSEVSELSELNYPKTHENNDPNVIFEE